jgi:hypothetical protein
VPNYIEEVFSTWLYTGTGAAQTITNGIDLAGKGGLVWAKDRSSGFNHELFDTARGTNSALISNLTAAAQSYGPYAYNSNGFGYGSGYVGNANTNGVTYASWTFREQPKFFDVVTYTGDGSGTTLQVPHNLGSKPGCIIIKRTDASGNWGVLHQGNNVAYTAAWTGFSLNNGSNSNFYGSTLNLSSAVSDTFFRPHNVVDVSGGRFNVSGATYVAYLFAHNAGGFGLTGTDNVISCGSYTGTGAAGNAITLGYEPQWLLVKNVLGAQNWEMFDNMRGLPTGGSSSELFPNTSSAERTAFNIFNVTATGFVTGTSALDETNASGNTYIYIAIRRGPMKTPTTGTSVFGMHTATSATSPSLVSSFPVDMLFTKNPSSSGYSPFISSRLTSEQRMNTGSSAAEATDSTFDFDYQNGALSVDITGYQGWMYRRAPGFFDEVCYTGNSTGGRTVAHNLAAVPELMIVKSRSVGGTFYDWAVYSAATGPTQYMWLNSTNLANPNDEYWQDTTPTASVFSLGNGSRVNSSGQTYVAYLFASCPGVSKVGSYTGTGTTQTINCGFTAGSRFVLIKRTDSTGDWYVWDSARGIVAGNDPYLLLNSTAAEVASIDVLDASSGGFIVNQEANTNLNVNGATYIFLAIA